MNEKIDVFIYFFVVSVVQRIKGVVCDFRIYFFMEN